MDLPTPERILIVRLTAIGDVIHSAPVACALRDRFPDASIGWIVEGAGGDLLEGHRAINELIRVPRRWYQSPRAVLDLRRRVQALEFDTTVDVQCLTKSSAVAWVSGAKHRLGASGPHGRELSPWLNNVLTPVTADHVVHRYLQILRPLGIDVTPQGQPKGFDAIRFDLEETDLDAAFAERAIEALELEPERFVVLNPGAGWPSKLWPAERYGELAERLLVDHGLHSLTVWAGAKEKKLAERIVAKSKLAARLAGPTTLRQLGAICKRAALFVGSDTGPMHLSVAVGTPTISLHGVTRGERCGAYGPGNMAIQADYPQHLVTSQRRDDNAAMRAIRVETVAGACGQLFGRRRRIAA